MTRSFLFVPADSERKLAKAGRAGADALILDLEDAVEPAARSAARQQVAEFLADRSDTWVRINPLDSDDAQADLAAAMPGAPAGIVLPKSRGADDVMKLASRLDELEKQHRIEAGSTQIMAICTERPEAIFALQGYADTSARLSALTWGAEDLASALGASANRDADGNWLPVYEMARSLCLCAAGMAGVSAIDTVYTDFRDLEGLQRYAGKARRDGFRGMLAIHPAQVDVINRAFLPTAAEIEHAERVVALFAANPGAGTLSLDGAMLDRPHRLQAEKLLELAQQLTARDKGTPEPR